MSTVEISDEAFDTLDGLVKQWGYEKVLRGVAELLQWDYEAAAEAEHDEAALAMFRATWPEASPKDGAFANALQYCHDDGDSPESMIARFRGLAEKHGLDTGPVEHLMKG